MATVPFRPTQREIAAYERDITKWLLLPAGQQNLFVENIARSMLERLLLRNRRNWQAVLKAKRQSLALHQGIQQELRGTLGMRVAELLTENARLIQGIPVELAQKTSRYIAEQQRNGVRAEEIEKTLRRKLPQMAKSRIRLIARTEVGKAETALTVARAETIGLTWGQWLTSEDARVRKSHANLDKVLVRFTDPPQPEQLIHEKSTLGPGLPGEFPYCRCVLNPLVSLEQVRWPARCYMNGRIERLTRSQFLKFLPALPIAA